MPNAGSPAMRELPDNWAVVSRFRSPSAQWEHTLAVTGTGVEVLTF